MNTESGSPSRASFALAPSGLVRAAAWPLQALSGFGEPELSRLPLGASHFSTAYRQVLAREREYLWSWFGADTHFERALCIASPSARRRIRSAAARVDGVRNRAMRLAEHTLYRYQARAAGRFTPNGLWSGVSALRFGTETRIDPAPPGYRFTPDLRPFQALLRALGQRPDYRRRSLWRLNPTLTLGAAGRWEFLHRSAQGEVRRAGFGADPKLSPLLATLASLPPLSLDKMAAELAGDDVWSMGARRGLLQLLEQFAGGGVLVGGLDLSESFETVWQALAAAAERLSVDDRRVWQNRQGRLHDLCADLGQDLEQRSIDSLLAKLQAARDEVVELGRRLQVNATEIPAQVLHCDRRLGWELTLGSATTAQLLIALTEYQSCWLDGTSPATAYRQLARRQLQEGLGETGLALLPALAQLLDNTTRPPPIWPGADAVEDPGVRGRLQRWSDCIESASAVTTLERAPLGTGNQASRAPLGCLFLGLEDGSCLSPHSISDIPTLASGRFAGLVDCGAVNEWLRARLRDYALRSGRRPAQLRLPFEANPNVLAAPGLVDAHCSPWSAEPGPSLLGASLRAGADPGEIELQLAQDDQPWVLMSLGAAHQQARDPLAQLLLWTGHHESPGRGQRAVDVPTSAELQHGRASPQVRLPGGARLRQRRTLVARQLSLLLGGRGIDRFRHWQKLAREYAWPERLQVAFAGGETLRIHRDSPLAVEALFKGVGADCPWMAVATAEPETGLAIPGLGQCAVELALPFARGSGESGHG